jgi:hypothetical protein
MAREKLEAAVPELREARVDMYRITNEIKAAKRAL